MAEGPVSVNQSSQDKSSCQEEQELVVVEPDVTCGHCKRELNNPYLLCCLHSVCKDCLPNLEVKDGRLKCTQCGDTSTHCNDKKMLEIECRMDSLHCVPVPNGPLARYIEGMKIVQKVTKNVPIPCGNKRCKSGDSPSTVFCTHCTKFMCNGACPVNCTVEPKPETVRSNGTDPITLTLNTFDSKNIRCKRGGDNVEAFLRPKSPIPGPAIKAKVLDDENGQYTLSFPITYPGECDLSILVNGSDVGGSPFGVNFLPKLKTGELNKNVAELGANKGHLNFPQQPGGPWGIAVAPNGHTFIADYTSHQIYVFDEQRKYIRSFGQRGKGNGQLLYPTGIAVDADGLLYVCSRYNHCIEVFTMDGTFVKQLGLGHLSNPWGVTVNNKQVYVANSGSRCISIFTLEGQLIRTIGSPGSGPGQFNHPSAVAISPDGDMYVTDHDDESNQRVQLFSPDSVFQREFGKGQLNYPRDILITADGHVLVADADNNSRVVIFSTTGQLIHTFQVGSQPFGLAVDHNGDLLVTLDRDKQVAIF